MAVATSQLDRDLLNQCLSGSEEAWRGFCDRFAGLILHVVRHVAGAYRIPLDESTSDDLVAEVFCTLLERDCAVLRRFRGDSSLATYLVVIARRTAMRQLLQRQALPTDAVLEMDQLPDYSRNATPDHPNWDWESEEAVRGLSQEEAHAIRMFHLEGKSYREIGHHLGMSENSIGPFLSRAREKIRQRA
jgi:RNA polymerase sigma-70 factor (ECF subfamily)